MPSRDAGDVGELRYRGRSVLGDTRDGRMVAHELDVRERFAAPQPQRGVESLACGT
jgi:hypothetical protein